MYVTLNVTISVCVCLSLGMSLGTSLCLSVITLQKVFFIFQKRVLPNSTRLKGEASGMTLSNPGKVQQNGFIISEGNFVNVIGRT